MADGNAASEGAPGENFDVVVKVNGDSLHVVLTDPEWKIMRALLKDATTAPDPKPGDKMPDGTIYAGVSLDTHESMYATPSDAPLCKLWLRKGEAGLRVGMVVSRGHKRATSPCVSPGTEARRAAHIGC